MRGPAVLSIRTGAPILPVPVVRKGPGVSYQVAYGEPIRTLRGARRELEIRRVTGLHERDRAVHPTLAGAVDLVLPALGRKFPTLACCRYTSL